MVKQVLKYLSAFLATRERNPARKADHFDADWYAVRYPDIARAGVEPLAHFLRHGIREGRDPNPYFDTDYYLAANPDAGANPLLHYANHGRAAGRPTAFHFGKGRRRWMEALAVARDTLGELTAVEPELAESVSVGEIESLPYDTGQTYRPAYLAWRQLFTSLTRPYDRIIFTGGSRSEIGDDAAVDVSGSTLVVATDGASAWERSVLPAHWDFRALRDLGPELSLMEQAEIVTAMIHHLQPRETLNLGSAAAAHAFADHRALRASGGDVHGVALWPVAAAPNSSLPLEGRQRDPIPAGVDITAVINLHGEGALCRAALLSAERAANHARQRGLGVELILVLDRPSRDTLDYIAASASGRFRTLTTDHNDIGLARNAGAGAARGTWISFLDGDNFWHEAWLTLAHACASRDSRRVIWRPLAQIRFGRRRPGMLVACLDMEDQDYDPLNISMSNHWPHLCFAPREAFLSCPYPASDPDRGIGFEDWAWNMTTIAAGWLHKTVPGTIYGRRLKVTGSLEERSWALRVLPTRTSLFRTMLTRQEKRPLPPAPWAEGP